MQKVFTFLQASYFILFGIHYIISQNIILSEKTHISFLTDFISNFINIILYRDILTSTIKAYYSTVSR